MSLKRIIVSCIFLGLFTVQCFAQRDIRLKRNHNNEKLRSLTSELPVLASTDNSGHVLSIQFLDNIDSIYISIINSLGEIVYSEMIEAIEFSSLIIPLETEAAGNYSLQIVSETSNLTGEFSIE